MTARTVIVIQARLASSRLPKKILAPLGTSTMLEQIVRRCRAAKKVDEVVVAVPTGDVEEVFNATGIAAIGGPEKDVLTRLLIAAHHTKATRIIRVTADCPLMCPRMIEAMADHHTYCKKPVAVNWIGRSFPDGLDLEVYDVEWLKAQSIKEGDREYFAQWITENYPATVVERVINPDPMGRTHRWTVDHPEDLEFVTKIYLAMKGEIWDTRTILGYIDTHKHLKKINAMRIDGTYGRRTNNSSNLFGG